MPELNVQNGVLKSLSFLFEYIGEMGKDYIYAVTPLLEDALMDRDLVHRQTAASVVQHMALGVAGAPALPPASVSINSRCLRPRPPPSPGATSAFPATLGVSGATLGKCLALAVQCVAVLAKCPAMPVR